MRLDKIQRRLIEVENYPDLRVAEPTLAELTEIAEKLQDIDPVENREATAVKIVWFMKTFVRGADGKTIEGLTKTNVYDQVSNGMLVACLHAARGAKDEIQQAPPG